MPRYPLKYRKPPRRRLRLSRVLTFLALIAMIVSLLLGAAR